MRKLYSCLVALTLGIAWVPSTYCFGERPNILFIIADDASRSSFGTYGSPDVATPAFDRIAREGIRFDQAYNCNPKCSPARACLLTGRYSWQLEESCNHFSTMSDQWQFYPYLLEEKGYKIGYTGKGWGPGRWLGETKTANGQRTNPAGPPWNRRQLEPPFDGITTTDYAGNFSDFLSSLDKDEPFCFWLGTKEPHRAYQLDSWKIDGRDLSKVTVPKYWPDNETVRGDLADYAIEVEWFDRQIGLALKSLEATGKLDNTLIIATSDHGMPFPRVKGQIYEHGFHVPFVVRWGDKISPGRVVTDFITFPDLAPTLLDLVEIDIPSQMTGKSFLPQLLSDDSGRIDPTRDHTLLGKERHDIGRTDGEMLSVGYPARAIRNDRFLYVRNFKPNRWPVGDPKYGFRNCDGSPTKSFITALKGDPQQGRWFKMNFGKRPSEELYDITVDPDCVHNLADSAEHAEFREQLWQQLETELRAQEDPRILGAGDVFEHYKYARANAEEKLYGRASKQ